MAKYCTDFVVATPYFKEGFIYQTGVGGASIASTIYLAEVMRQRNIRMGLGLGGIATPMVTGMLGNGTRQSVTATTWSAYWASA